MGSCIFGQYKVTLIITPNNTYDTEFFSIFWYKRSFMCFKLFSTLVIDNFFEGRYPIFMNVVYTKLLI